MRLRFRAQGGFTFIGIIISVAVLGVGLAGLGQVWGVKAKREREQELLFVGEQYRAAIFSYVSATPAGKPRYPRQLDDLLDDKRHPVVRRHLRQLYPDPLTGRADWEVVLAADGGIAAIHTRADGRSDENAATSQPTSSRSSAPRRTATGCSACRRRPRWGRPAEFRDAPRARAYQNGTTSHTVCRQKCGAMTHPLTVILLKSMN